MTVTEAYKYCIYCGTKYPEPKGNVLKCSNCSKNFFVDCSFGAGGICENKEGKIILIKRARDPFKGTWDVPAGFIDLTDKSIEDALRREVKEELGVEIDNIKYLSSHPTIYTYQGVDKPHMTLFYTCSVIDEADLSKTDEVESYKFFNIDEINLDEIGFDCTQLALKDYINLKTNSLNN